jgi:glycosyltransferase involved in cell wall biosynthesis
MRVVHAVTSIDPSYGGPTAVVMGLAAARASIGPTRVVSCTGRDPDAAPTRANLARLAELGVATELVRDPGLRGYAGSRLDHLVRDADVVHLHGVWDPLLLAMARSATALSVPFVVCPHGTLAPKFLAQKALKKRLAMRLGVRSMLDHAALLHVLNERERDDVGLLGLDPPRAVIPNGIDLRDCAARPERGALRSRLGIGDAPMALFLSRLHPEKGLDLLVPAFGQVLGQVPGAHLVIAGPDYGAQVATERLVLELGLGASVHLTGPLFGTAKWQALADADAFILPSRYEGFSVAVLEAMACGLATVITTTCHFPEAARAGAALETACSADELAAALRTLLADIPAARAMGQRAAALVRERYTWTEVARNVEGHYGRLCGRAAP